MNQCRKTLWNPKSLDSALDYFFWCIICWLFYCFYKCRAQALLRLMGSKAKWSQATNSEGFSSTIQSDLFGSGKSRVNSILLISYYYFGSSSKLFPFLFAKVYIRGERILFFGPNTNIIRNQNFDQIRIRIIFVFQKWMNMNTNIIRFWKMDEYKYE